MDIGNGKNGDNKEGIDYQGFWSHGSSVVKIKRKGIIFKSIHDFSDKEILNIRGTSTHDAAAFGNIWLEYINYSTRNDEAGAKPPIENQIYFLTTNNNTAMIQSNVSSEVLIDEIKIMANTIAYLKQRTEEKSITYDNYVLDTKAPNSPEIQIDKNLTNDNKISITYTSEDNGSKYEFKVKAYEKEGTEPVKESNEISKTIATGVKGFYYKINSLPEYDFDVNNASYEETGKLELGLEYQGQYIHIKAVDKAGNIGEVSNKLINIYDNITITTDWQDENNKYNVRPETIIMKLYRKHSQNEQGEHVGDYEAKVDKNKRVQVYTLKNMLVEDSDGKYEYYIETDKNLQHYETNFEGLRITNIYTGPIISSNLTIQGKEKIKTKDEAVNYSINYTVQIGRYEGNAIVIITNILPYELDEQKTDMQNGLDGGEYNKNQKTITWTIRETDINNLNEEGVKTISIKKSIAVVYSNIDTNKTNFANEVKGKVQLETGNIILEKDKEICATNTQFIKNIKVTKTWNHGSNKYERPTKITLQVKDGERIVAQYTIGQDDNWTHTFENLPKYRENGEEIEYTVDEEAIEGESLKYYRKNIN